jgi:hypothetical protein
MIDLDASQTPVHLEIEVSRSLNEGHHYHVSLIIMVELLRNIF